jgi:hypothetical protein
MQNHPDTKNYANIYNFIRVLLKKNIFFFVTARASLPRQRRHAGKPPPLPHRHSPRPRGRACERP